MNKKWLFISLVLILTVVGLSSCTAGNFKTSPSNLQIDLNNQQEGIWVSGTGVVTVTPDIANLRLGVEARADIVAVAQSQAVEAMDKLMKALTDNGIAEKDIQTQYFNISQITKWDSVKQEAIVIGYQVTNKVNAKIREIDKAGAIVDAVVVAGGDLTRIDSISFSVDDPTAYYETAREKAMADAKAKAEQLAELAGSRVGKATYISESMQIPPIIYRAGAEAAPAPTETSISPGELDISLTVQVGYALLD